MTTKHKVPQLSASDRHVITQEEQEVEPTLSNDLTLKVRNFDRDIASFKSHITTLKEQLQEIVEATDEYHEIEELTEKLKVARESLKRKLENNSRYVDLMSELADERLSLKDAEANMSDFLLGYFADTHERQIELGPKDAREVILKGKLGKPKDFQTNLFSQGGNDG